MSNSSTARTPSTAFPFATSSSSSAHTDPIYISETSARLASHYLANPIRSPPSSHLTLPRSIASSTRGSASRALAASAATEASAHSSSAVHVRRSSTSSASSSSHRQAHAAMSSSASISAARSSSAAAITAAAAAASSSALTVPAAPLTPTTLQNTTDVILTRVFQDQTNVLKRDDRELIIEFLNGRLRVNPFDPTTSLHRIILNESKHKDPLHPTRTTIEQIVFEMNFTSGHWRKLRRKAVVRDVVPAERLEDQPSKDECPGAEWWSGRIPAGWDSNGNRIEAIQAVTAVASKHAAMAVTPREVYVCGR